MQKHKSIGKLVTKILLGVSAIAMVCAVSLGTASARGWHHHEGHWHGGYAAPDYYYAPSPGYYTAPEPYEYYGPQPAPAPSGFGLFFGF